jgi:hypothetical protein
LVVLQIVVLHRRRKNPTSTLDDPTLERNGEKA